MFSTQIPALTAIVACIMNDEGSPFEFESENANLFTEFSLSQF